ncbi:MAG TPA: cupin domain-containing protein [Pseudonocardiaceae bacterium]
MTKPAQQETQSHQQTGEPAEQRDFAQPDDVRTFEFGQVELVTVAGAQIGRLTLHPGWRWSEHVKPIAGTELCEAPHFQYHAAGTVHIKMADGTEFDATPGQVTALPSGHDAWVVGDEDVVLIDWWGASDYAK